MGIKLNDLLKLKSLENVKIRFNLPSSSQEADAPYNDPIKAYQRDHEEIILKNLYKSDKRQYFNVGDIVIGLFPINEDEWLLFDISEITSEKDDINSEKAGFAVYGHKTLKEYDDFYGRLTVRYHKTGQNPVRKAEGLIDDLYIFEMLPENFNRFANFPGYENVNLNFEELKQALNSKAWQTALQNQKGVYLITDTLTNKRYVGSAYGKEMMLGRWKHYVENGHGGNVKLVKLVNENGFDYVKKNFRYCILEIYKNITPDEFIIGRESFWKEVFLTRNDNFGYNNN